VDRSSPYTLASGQPKNVPCRAAGVRGKQSRKAVTDRATPRVRSACADIQADRNNHSLTRSFLRMAAREKTEFFLAPLPSRYLSLQEHTACQPARATGTTTTASVHNFDPTHSEKRLPPEHDGTPVEDTIGGGANKTIWRCFIADGGIACTSRARRPTHSPGASTPCDHRASERHGRNRRHGQHARGRTHSTPYLPQPGYAAGQIGACARALRPPAEAGTLSDHAAPSAGRNLERNI
jgi:hypothetical protein